MEKEFNLSERTKPQNWDYAIIDILFASDVREFIRLLKEKLRKDKEIENSLFLRIELDIDKLAGEALNK